MKNHNKPWTAEQMSELRRYCESGLSDYSIASRMGRTYNAIQTQRSINRILKNKVKPSAKFIRYEKPSTQISILWGLVKFSKG